MDEVIDIVNDTIERFERFFRRGPTRFFTENDVVCSFHAKLSSALENWGLLTASDSQQAVQSIVHCEYPTPFRCDMAGHGFEVRQEADRTPGGGGYRRGHIDLVVFNPDRVRDHNYSQLRGQNWQQYQAEVLPGLAEERSHLIAYGLEFLYRRDDFAAGNQADLFLNVQSFVDSVVQDARKLAACRNRVPGFMRSAKTLVFLHGVNHGLDWIRDQLTQTDDIRIIAP
jgi:hypothetical protein